MYSVICHSYKLHYDFVSQGAIVGCKTKKVLQLVVKNKTCLICGRAKSKNVTVREHECSINHVGSSSSMEPAAIVEGFKNSFRDQGLVYRFLLADGDSATYQQVLLANPYAELGIRVTKIQCKNHILRRLCTNLRKLCESLSNKCTRILNSNRYLKPKETVQNKIFALRMGIDRACSFRGREGKLNQDICNLRNDITSSAITPDARRIFAMAC